MHQFYATPFTDGYFYRNRPCCDLFYRATPSWKNSTRRHTQIADLSSEYWGPLVLDKPAGGAAGSLLPHSKLLSGHYYWIRRWPRFSKKLEKPRQMFAKKTCFFQLYLRDALMDFDIPKAGHVFETSSSKLPVDFLGSEQIPRSNFHDLDFSIFRIAIFRNRKFPKSKSWKFDVAIWSDRERKLQALKNSFRKRVQPSGYQNPRTQLGVTRVRKSWLIAIFWAKILILWWLFGSK